MGILGRPGARKDPKELKGYYYDQTLRKLLSWNSVKVLCLCPVDIFFTAQNTRLHGKTLRSLAEKGYLNMDPSKDGLQIEYYVNNHGHRVIKDNLNGP